MLLVVFGITMIRSTVTGNIDVADNPQQQLLFAFVGFIAIFVMASIDYHLWASFRGALMLVTLFSLLLLRVAGGALFGSTRWFRIGPISLQPSEFAKIVVILVLADYFTQNIDRMGEVRVIARSIIPVALVAGMVLLQPNLSTAIVVVVIWFALLWVAGLKVKHLVLFTAGTLLVLAVATPVLIETKVIQDYQLKRITNFISPDPNAREGEGWNIEQAQISIGSGGLLGQGYGRGSQVQLRFLKVRWSDFIFASMAQEFGFVGTILVILVLLFVIYRCLRIARLSRDTYGALICYGVAVLLVFQAIVNIGVNLKLMPATGLTFPFVSYGGSSLLANLVAIGLVESVMLRHKALEF